MLILLNSEKDDLFWYESVEEACISMDLSMVLDVQYSCCDEEGHIYKVYPLNHRPCFEKTLDRDVDLPLQFLREYCAKTSMDVSTLGDFTSTKDAVEIIRRFFD